ncbi:zinc ABC transporter substrate-binding protein [uncultured Tateyamaria sp.]|uniref:zinc ABC transporter substrate-binding protein n=1 Tax=uncultured Tateyamaria sp. TaxID=455651 RepID=UPI0026169E86|nr:zinc ABC transporter substrate-binding protein [uncultured Tateyamaria sp.]
MRYAMAAMIVGIGAGAAQAEVPRVAADIAPIHSIVAAIMGDVGSPDLITPPTASPHSHQMRPSEARALDQADIVVWVGHALTPWLEGPVGTLAEGAHVIELIDLDGTELLDVREGAAFGAHNHDHGHEEPKEAGHGDHQEHAHDKKDAHEEDGHDGHADEEHAHADNGHEEHAQEDEHEHEEHGHEVEHAHGQHAEAHDEHAGHDDHAGHAAHGSTDPHVWLAPANAAFWAGVIAEELAEHDPSNAAIYKANAAEFINDLKALEAEIEAMVDPYRGRPFVVFHDAYHYFEHRFDIEALGSVSTGDAAAPSAGRMSELQEAVMATGAVCALTEPQFNPGLLTALGPVKLGEIDPLGAKLEPGPTLYPDLLRNMGSALAECLS